MSNEISNKYLKAAYAHGLPDKNTMNDLIRQNPQEFRDYLERVIAAKTLVNMSKRKRSRSRGKTVKKRKPKKRRRKTRRGHAK